MEYYAKTTSRSGLHVIYICAFLLILPLFVVWATETWFIVPIVIILLFGLARLINSFRKNEYWEVRIENETLAWRSPNDNGDIVLSEIDRIQLHDNSGEATICFTGNKKEKMIEWIGNSQQLKTYLQQHHENVCIEWIKTE